jgi:tannase
MGAEYQRTWGEYITQFLQLVDIETLPNLNNITYDTLRDWMYQGWQTYEDTTQTTWPDLTPFQSSGGKILQYHGEADPSIPTASSVRYWNSVRSIMYPNLSFQDGANALGEWYRLYLVPGAAHCSPNTAQPNGPFPQTTLATLIDWVENGVKPDTLNGTVLQGPSVGEKQQICPFPLRPLWISGKMGCEYDQKSIDTWLYDFNSFKMPVY